MKKTKKRVMVLFGGRSGEHEVSLRSAVSVITHLDREKYEVIPIKITKQGKWMLQSPPEAVDNLTPAILANEENSFPVVMPLEATGDVKMLNYVESVHESKDFLVGNVDVVFPVMHGTFSEDGTIQGLLELADVAYVGSGVLASAVGMDKEFGKRLAREAGLRVTPFLVLRTGSWNLSNVKSQVEEFGYPVFVKPSNLGSSVGIHKVDDPSQLEAAILDAFRYDLKVLIEKGVAAREIELSVLENSELGKPPLVSIPGEIVPHHAFYTYAAKYLDENGASLIIPADLRPEQIEEAQAVGRKSFQALDCEGMARVDLFLDRMTGEIYFNELNTLPGFTSISMYPKLWEASGISYKELLSRLVELALSRHERKRSLKRTAEDYLPEPSTSKILT